MDNLISIIVPVYKVEKYLRRCVDSILSQTYQNIEVLLIDDGSPDSSGDICDKYSEKDPRVRVFHKENGGVSSARNMALDIARGEYVSFIDSDDFIQNNTFEVLIKELLNNSADAIRFAYYITYSDDKNAFPAEVSNDIRVIDNREQFLNDLHYDGHKAAFIANKVFKKCIIGDIRFNNILWHRIILMHFRQYIRFRRIRNFFFLNIVRFALHLNR